MTEQELQALKNSVSDIGKELYLFQEDQIKKNSQYQENIATIDNVLTNIQKNLATVVDEITVLRKKTVETENKLNTHPDPWWTKIL